MRAWLEVTNRRHCASTCKAAEFLIAVRVSPQLGHHFLCLLNICDTVTFYFTFRTSTRRRKFQRVLPLNLSKCTVEHTFTVAATASTIAPSVTVPSEIDSDTYRFEAKHLIIDTYGTYQKRCRLSDAGIGFQTPHM